jgi:pyrimidine deaminase RibD-like protein
MATSDLHYLRLALTEARKSPPKPTNFCVGAVLVYDGKVLSTGYTLECPGNTHAEQSCFRKLAGKLGACSTDEDSPGVDTEEKLGRLLPEEEAMVLYTTMEPCNKRSVGNTPCVERILALRRVKRVVCGVREPETFVGQNEGRRRLEEAGIEVAFLAGLEEEILKVATVGHEK